MNFQESMGLNIPRKFSLLCATGMIFVTSVLISSTRALVSSSGQKVLPLSILLLILSGICLILFVTLCLCLTVVWFIDESWSVYDSCSLLRCISLCLYRDFSLTSVKLDESGRRHWRLIWYISCNRSRQSTSWAVFIKHEAGIRLGSPLRSRCVFWYPSLLE